MKMKEKRDTRNEREQWIMRTGIRELEVREWVEKNRLLTNRKINININKKGGNGNVSKQYKRYRIQKSIRYS